MPTVITNISYFYKYYQTQVSKAQVLRWDLLEAESKEKHGVWDPVPELTITLPDSSWKQSPSLAPSNTKLGKFTSKVILTAS